MSARAQSPAVDTSLVTVLRTYSRYVRPAKVMGLAGRGNLCFPVRAGTVTTLVPPDLATRCIW